MLVFRYIDPEFLALILVQAADKYAAKRENRELPEAPAASIAGDQSCCELELLKTVEQPLH